MSLRMKKHNHLRRIGGFTIIELLIVIVIIGILSLLVVITYRGIQSRAYDSRRVNDARTLVKAIKLYAVKNGSAKVLGGGLNGNGYSYVNVGNQPSGSWSYPTIVEKLNDEGLSRFGSTVGDPKYLGLGGDFALYQCLNGSGVELGEFGVFFYLDTPLPQYSANLTKYRNGSCGSVAQNDTTLNPWNAVITETY
jgi:prepilin-type N-terminal cleavage/methylation domain-containing protein